MTSLRIILVGAVLGAFGQVALAFQETNSGGGQAGAAASPPAIKALDLGGAAAARAAGPEIKVPGLGTIGSLPKLDFGLELLYGATAQQTGPRDDKSESGAQIRGTLKYRFPN